jgi:hypothetical protein
MCPLLHYASSNHPTIVTRLISCAVEHEGNARAYTYMKSSWKRWDSHCYPSLKFVDSSAE